MPNQPPSPNVSVILPTHNRAVTLKRAIDSVLAQTYADFELLIIDDGSSDQTAVLVGSYEDARLRYIPLPERGGAGAARNHGLSVACGCWIAFQDSDDEWRSEKLALQVRATEEASPEVGVIYTNYQRAVSTRMISGIPSHRTFSNRFGLRSSRLDGNPQHTLARGNFIPTQTAMVRKSCLQQVGGFDECLPRLQDWDLWLRLARNYTFIFINQPLVRIYPSPGSISSQPDHLENAFERILKKHEPQRALYRSLQAQYHFALGDVAVHQGAIREGREHFNQALHLSPTNTAYWFAALAAQLGIRAYLWYIQKVGLSYVQ